MENGAVGLSDVVFDEVVKRSVTEAPVEVENGESKVLRVAQGLNTQTIAPVTPVPVKEVKDIRVPRAVVQCGFELTKIDVENIEECEECTPKKGVFDTFVLGPDDTCLARRLWKKVGESRVNVARQLDFDSLSSSESSMRLGKMKSDEEKLLESVYGGDLDFVVPCNAELDEAEKVVTESESDGFKTPEKVPCFNGTGNKCPDAPMKQERTISSKRLHVDSRLCRKLEF